MNAVKSLIYKDYCTVRKNVAQIIWFAAAMAAVGLLMVLSIRTGNLRPLYEAQEQRINAEFLMVTMEQCFALTCGIGLYSFTMQHDKRWTAFVVSSPVSADEYALSKTVVSAFALLTTLPLSVIYAAAMCALYPYQTMLPHIRLMLLIVSLMTAVKSISDAAVNFFKSVRAAYFLLGGIGIVFVTVCILKLFVYEEDMDIETMIASLHTEITGPAAPFAAAAVIAGVHFLLRGIYKRRAD